MTTKLWAEFEGREIQYHKKREEKALGLGDEQAKNMASDRTTKASERCE